MENPKLVRFDQYMNKLNIQGEKFLCGYQNTPSSTHSLSELLENFKANIVQDTYESLTIEGYKVSKEDIVLLDKGRKEGVIKKISSEIDIKGYLDSYKVVLDKLNSNHNKTPPITHDFLLDINLTLFSHYPVAKKYNIPREYRKNNVRITGTKYLPPEHSLVDAYMQRFIVFINNLETSTPKNILKKAILAHFFFTHIHPFGDGNGRTGRLLMNYILVINGMEYTTIKAEQRDKYISCLKEATENENIVPFSQFILDQL